MKLLKRKHDKKSQLEKTIANKWSQLEKSIGRRQIESPRKDYRRQIESPRKDYKRQIESLEFVLQNRFGFRERVARVQVDAFLLEEVAGIPAKIVCKFRRRLSGFDPMLKWVENIFLHGYHLDI